MLRFKSRLPWALAFSFARAIQQPALELWKGQEANVSGGAEGLFHRARCNQAARRGEYSARDGEEMTGSKHNHEGNSGDSERTGPRSLLAAHAS
jgi:fructose-bisphosphate aldolase class I